MAIEFDDIGNGELRAKFHIAMARIRNNIMDPNMDPEAARSITINIKFMPDESGSVRSAFNVKTKLADCKASKTIFLIGQDAKTGKIEMTECGNNRPQVAAYDAFPPAPKSQDPGQQDFNPETGEIYQQPTKPIDLRRAAGN